MQVIQELQGNRPEIVKLYDEFVRAVPDGVYFTQMTLKGKQISLVGYAESNNRVSALMRRLDASYKFAEPNLTKVQADPILGEDGSRFEMRVKVITAPVETESPAKAEGEA
ncbi:PilN domain-containing protein [Porticoccus sp.]